MRMRVAGLPREWTGDRAHRAPDMIAMTIRTTMSAPGKRTIACQRADVFAKQT
jgi:hypothetical protein